MYFVFIFSLIGLSVAALAAFITAYRKAPYPLVVFIPMLALCSSFLYQSYEGVLGYPVDITWQQLPSKITVIYFRVNGKKDVTLWLLVNRNTTRLVRLPYDKLAEESLEKQRKKMGEGIPVTFTKEGTGSGTGKGKGFGKGKPGQGGASREGWKYKVNSYGEPISGSLPPK